jgi:hypothetical protein
MEQFAQLFFVTISVWEILLTESAKTFFKK